MSIKNHLSLLESAGLIHVDRVEPELAYRFRHGLIEQAAHSSLVRADRRRLHALVGQRLEALYPDQLDDLAAVLALHFAAAGERDKAIGYYRRAARLAQSRYANQEAVQLLQDALALIGAKAPDELRLAVLEELADAHSRLGQVTEALVHLQAALTLEAVQAGADPWRNVRLHRKLIETLTASAGSVVADQVEAAMRANAAALEAAPRLASGESHAETVRLLSALAQWHARIQFGLVRWLGDLDEAEKYAARAVAIAEHLAAPADLSIALGVLAEVHYVRGRLRERLAIAQRRLAQAGHLSADDERQRLNVLISGGAALAEVGEYAQAIPHLEQAEQQAAAMHAVTPRIYALRLLVQCWFGLDGWARVLGVVEQCRSLAQQHTQQQTGPLCFELALSASVHAWRGEMALAQAERQESYAIMASVSGPPETWARQQHY